MSGLLFELRGGKSSSHPSQKGAQEALLFFWVAGAPPTRNLTPPLSHRPPTYRERGTQLERWFSYSVLLCNGNDVKTQTTSTIASAKSPSPGRWEGDGRGDRGEVSGGGLPLPPPHLPVHPPHEPVQPKASQQQHPRDHRRREHPIAVAGEEPFQGGGEEPHLHDQEDGDQGQGAVDGGEAPALGRWMLGRMLHTQLLSVWRSTPTAIRRSPWRWRTMRGSGRCGGPASTRPSCAEKYPWWQGHSKRALCGA